MSKVVLEALASGFAALAKSLEEAAATCDEATPEPEKDAAATSGGKGRQTPKASPAPAPAPKAAPAKPSAQPKKVTPKATLDQVKEKLKAMRDATDNDTLKALFSEFGSTGIKDLDEENYDGIIERATEIMAGAASVDGDDDAELFGDS